MFDFSRKVIVQDSFKLNFLIGPKEFEVIFIYNYFGWEVYYISIKKSCSPSCEPYILEIFERDGIDYPNSLTKQLKYLWSEIGNRHLTIKAVQKEFNKLAYELKILNEKFHQGLWKEFNH